MKINDIAIELKNLYCVYNEKTDRQFIALRNINYTFKKGKIYFIIGKSGCGKSTLLSFFNGLSFPKYGSVQIGNNVLDSKNNLNNAIINVIETVDDSVCKKIKFDKNTQKILIFECASDLRKNQLFIFLNAYNRVKDVSIKSINSKNIKKKNNKNKLYACVVDKNFIFDKKIIVNTENNKCYTGSLIKKKKVKNYKEIRKQVGVVYQFPEFQLFKPTILEEVMFGPINLGFNKEDAKNNSIKILNELKIPEKYFDNSPFGLSGGQKRRVALSGILASDPEFLVFDEPTAGLDPKGEADMLNIILKAKENKKTIFVVTHSMEQVLEIADEVIVMDDGQIVRSGTPYEIFCDEKIVDIASVILPNTISFINELVKIDNKYKALYGMQPRNAEQLVECLNKIRKVKNV